MELMYKELKIQRITRSHYLIVDMEMASFKFFEMYIIQYLIYLSTYFYVTSVDTFR